MRAPRFARILLATALAILPVSASALPVTYNLTSGTVTVTATLLPTTTILLNGSGSAAAALTGTSFTFDAALVPLAGNDGSISAFQFVTAPSGPFTLSPTVGGVTTISFGSLTATGALGFTSSATGTNPYNFTMGPILVTGLATTNLGAAAVNLTTPSATGSISEGANVISVLGITIGALPTTSGTVLLKGDFVFHGSSVTVPEPGTLALLIAGAIATGVARLRRDS